MKQRLKDTLPSLILMLLGIGISIVGIVYGVNSNKLIYIVAFSILAAVFIAVIFVELFAKRKEPDEQEVNNNFPSPEDISVSKEDHTKAALLGKYSSLEESTFPEVGYVSFVNQGIKFSAEGKYGYIENFKGQAGFHFGFRIEGTELVSTPEDFEDIMDLESTLFNIEIGYFEEELLSDFENSNGVVLSDISNLEGKKIKIKQNAGYMAIVNTTDSDDIDAGEIEFVEWNKNSKVIRFKFLVDAGLNDIITGTVRLIEDEEANEID